MSTCHRVDASRGDARELILYAEPRGPLADQVDAYFRGVETDAQTYPPHCTLTGFFRDDDVERYIDAAATVLAPVVVGVAGLRTETEGWIGLELRSPDLHALTARFAAAVADPGTRVDTIRPKDWLHLSLAYGHDRGQHPELARRAVALVDPGAEVDWQLALYERDPVGTWHPHARWPLRH